MIRYFRASFRNQLFAALLCVSLIPLAIALFVMGESLRLHQQRLSQQEAETERAAVVTLLDDLHGDFLKVQERIVGAPEVRQALEGDTLSVTAVNAVLFSATEGMREEACFDLYDSAGKRRYSTTRSDGTETLPLYWGALQAARSGKAGLVYSVTEDAEDTAVPLLVAAAVIPRGSMERERLEAGEVSGSSEISGTAEASEVAGYLVIRMYSAHFRKLLEGKYGARNSLFVLSRYWRPVYSSDPGLMRNMVRSLRAELLTAGRLGERDGDFLYSASAPTESGLVVLLRRPNVFTRGMNALLVTISVAAVLFGFLISLGMSCLLSRRLMQPIERLHSAMREVTLDRLDVRVEESGDEFGELAGRFNLMTQALKENRVELMRNQEILVRNQRELNEAQIRMLQAQLNPHFLCNTLDTMKWMGKIHGIPQIAVISADLADILRFAISPDEFVTLRREGTALERYFEIQKIRHSERLSFELDIPESLQQCMVPKMLLQPLVENAILHGLEGVDSGVVRVEARSECGEEILRISVSDNGVGLPEVLTGSYKPQTGGTAQHHLGLYNVDTILKKHYGDGFGLCLENRREDSGAVIIARLPLQKDVPVRIRTRLDDMGYSSVEKEDLGNGSTGKAGTGIEDTEEEDAQGTGGRG